MPEPLLQVMPCSGVNSGSEFEECEWLSQVLGQVTLHERIQVIYKHTMAPKHLRYRTS
jgi:hypothetical protein